MKYLAIVAAGISSMHVYWNTAGVDMCIVYYGTDPEIAEKFKKGSKYFYKAEGPKWTIIKQAIQDLYHRYDKIWLPDDDVILSDPEVPIKKLFEIADKWKLDLAQPALINNGNITKQYVKWLAYRQGGPEVFPAEFIEVMAPILSRKAILRLLPIILDQNTRSGWGLDTNWSKDRALVKGLINSVPMVHTRAVSKYTDPKSYYIKFKINPYEESRNATNIYHTKIFKSRTAPIGKGGIIKGE